MAEYEQPGHYRSGFEDDEHRAPYASEFGGRAERRYATGYGYGPTYGGTAGAYGSSYGGPAGVQGPTYGATTGNWGAAGSGYAAGGGYGGSTAGASYTAGRYGASRLGGREDASFARRQPGTGSWRGENVGERQYPRYGRTSSGWTHPQESRFGEPGRAGIGQSVTALQEFGAYGPGVPSQRRRIGQRQYGPY